MMQYDFLAGAIPGLAIRKETPYSELTTLGVGGKLPLLAEPDNGEQLQTLLKLISSQGENFFVFGGGTDLVGADAPLEAVGIKLAREGFSGFAANANRVTAGAMLRLPELARRCAAAKLSGLAALAGIPGTVGGALRMNAGANGVEIGSLVSKVSGFRGDGTAWSADGDKLEWSYRSSSIPSDVIVTEVELELISGDSAKENAAIEAELAARRQREPGGRTAGCAFRNVSAQEPAGMLIDRAGLRGFASGALEVSPKHANYIVNRGKATEADCIELMATLRRAVAEKFGFYLRPEMKFVDPHAESKLLAAVPSPRINVLYGGVSSERDVSLRSGAAVAAALTNAGFEVELTDIKQCEVSDSMRSCDVVYPVLHGGFGEDGRLQKELEAAGLRFVGSGSAASDLVMDKVATKRMLDNLAIPTARWCVLTAEHRELPAGFTFPVILKVPREGSTVGIIKVDAPEKLSEALDSELAMAGEILAEEFVRGVEITVPLVNGEILPAIEIRSPHGFYDWDAKYVYKNGHTQYFCPVESLGKVELERAAEMARRFYFGAGCRDILRVDFIVSPDGVPYVLEGNSLPGCTATSLVPKAARVSGMSFERMTTTLVYAAMKRPLLSFPRERKVGKGKR
ncbi:MAG: D-alanine--D-alanine ligase [Victivallaceae bacterium]|nr:D-alanine--D-alanine ligase [Victivallaceae bacterium]